MFDVPPPFKSEGIDAYRRTWDLFFACSPEPVKFDIVELRVTAGPDVAFATALMQCLDGSCDGAGDAPSRATATARARMVFTIAAAPHPRADACIEDRARRTLWIPLRSVRACTSR